MAKFHLKNEQGFFAEIGREFIASKYAVDFLKKEAQNPSSETASKFSSSELEKISEFLKVIETLPKDDMRLVCLKNDKKDLKLHQVTPDQAYYDKGYGSDYVECFFLPFPTKFSPSSRMFSYSADIYRQEFLRSLQEINKIDNFKLLNSFAKFNEVSLGQKIFKKAKDLQEKLDKGVFTASDFNPANDFGKSEMCLIYVASKTGGAYISPNHTHVSLGSARIFESPAAAQKWIDDKRYQGKAVVVHAEIVIKKIGESATPVAGDLSRLKEAIATMERDALMKALEGATVEQLKERLAKYEDVSLIDQKNQPKKRAM